MPSRLKCPCKKPVIKLPLLKTSYTYQKQHYFDNSTAHGFRYLGEEGRPFVEKFVWFLCITTGAMVTLIIILTLWEKFQTNPTITSLDTDFHNWDVEFPGVALCPAHPHYNITYIAEKMKNEPSFLKATNKTFYSQYLAFLSGLSYRNIHRAEKYFNKSEEFHLQKINLKTLAFKVIVPCHELFSECKWINEVINCCEHFFPMFTEVGFCYGFNFQQYETKPPWDANIPTHNKQKYIYETDIKWEVSVKMANVEKNPTNLYNIMSIDQPGVDLFTFHTWDGRINRILISAKTTYTVDEAEDLSITQRRCVFPYEMKLKTNDLYTYATCMKECRMDYALDKCGCVPYFYKKINKYPYCNLEQLVCIGKIRDEIARKDLCPCELGCENTIYLIERLIDIFDDDSTTKELQIAFVAWPIYRYKREVMFGWVDLLVSFGGIAGLFLGFSLLSAVEVIYYFTMRACCMWCRDKEVLEELQKEYAAEVKPKLNLNLAPICSKNT